MFKQFSRFKNLLTITGVLFFAICLLTIPLHRMAGAHGPMGWKAPAKERKVKNPVPNTPESRSRGHKIYTDKCASCHGEKGDGQGDMGKELKPGPPNFTDRHMMKEMTDGEIFWKITTGKSPMPSYAEEFTEKERWDLVNYLRSFTGIR